MNDQRGDNRNFTAKLVSNSSWLAKPWANMKTTFGADYINTRGRLRRVERHGASSGRPERRPGRRARGQQPARDREQDPRPLRAGASRHSRRLFLTAAVRTDQNSAFGTQFQRVFYPKLSGSWIISDEDFFPHMNWLDQLRLRSAYGASGVQPGATTSLQTFSAVTRAINTTRPATRPDRHTRPHRQRVGQPGLRPRSLPSSSRASNPGCSTACWILISHSMTRRRTTR